MLPHSSDHVATQIGSAHLNLSCFIQLKRIVQEPCTRGSDVETMPRRRRQSSPARSTTRRDSGRAAARQPRDGERSPGSGHVAPSSGLAPGATTAKAADAACDAAGLRSSMYPTLPRWLRSAQGLGGTSGGSFYAPPPWVDVSKAPGTTAQPLSWRDWAWKVATCRMFFYSPNVVWALIAAAVYVAFPYDFEAAASVASLPAYGARRAALNLAVCGAYYGWWSATLYGPLAWARRKFRGVPSGRPGEWKPARSPSARVVARNMWFWALGVAQYTLWEVAVVHCFATGRLGYVADDEVFASVSSCVAFALGVVLMPVWSAWQRCALSTADAANPSCARCLTGGIHFYWAHRLCVSPRDGCSALMLTIPRAQHPHTAVLQVHSLPSPQECGY